MILILEGVPHGMIYQFLTLKQHNAYMKGVSSHWQYNDDIMFSPKYVTNIICNSHLSSNMPSWDVHIITFIETQQRGILHTHQ